MKMGTKPYLPSRKININLWYCDFSGRCKRWKKTVKSDYELTSCYYGNKRNWVSFYCGWSKREVHPVRGFVFLVEETVRKADESNL